MLHRISSSYVNFSPPIPFWFYDLNIFTISVLLILVSQRAEVQVVLLLGTEKMKQAMQESLKKQRGNPPTPLELTVVIYVLGFIWEETQEIFGEGIRSYLRNMWNFIDFSRNSLYCLVFLLRGIAYVQQMNQISEDPSTAFIPREHWDDFDPQLIVTKIPFISKAPNHFLSVLLFFSNRRKVCLRPQMFSQPSSLFISFRLTPILVHFKVSLIVF